MGRPQNASPRSYLLIAKRLIQEPLWLGDWASTGLKSRSTVNKRLRYLASLGLVERKRDGHKKLYFLTEDPFESPQWYYLLHTKAQKQKNINFLKKTYWELKSYLRRIEVFDNRLNKINQLRESDPKFNDLIKKAELNLEEMTFLEINRLFVSYSRSPLCLECLKEYDEIFPHVYDPELREYYCTQCGTFILRDFLPPWLRRRARRGKRRKKKEVYSDSVRTAYVN